MSLLSMKQRLRSYERKVFLGATALAGAGATAAVAKWQQGWGELSATRDSFIAATGENEVVSGAYAQLNETLDTLGAVVASGNKEAILNAGMKFYATLIDVHEVVARYVPPQIRGDEKDPPPETLMRISHILSSALGIS